MELHKLDTETQVFFYEQDFYVLSNFSSFEVTFNGEDYKTAEHAYHCQKFFVAAAGYHDIRKDIREARSAHDAFKIAQQHKHLQRVDWDEVKVNVMCEILREKVKQHEYVMRKLLATGDRELIEDSWRDSFWGWGEDRQGLNMLGKCWMRVRDDLRREFILKHSREALEREFQNVWGQKKEVGKDSVLNRLHSTHIEDGLIGQTIREAVSVGNDAAAEELARSLLGSEESPSTLDKPIKQLYWDPNEIGRGEIGAEEKKIFEANIALQRTLEGSKTESVLDQAASMRVMSDIASKMEAAVTKQAFSNDCKARDAFDVGVNPGDGVLVEIIKK